MSIPPGGKVASATSTRVWSHNTSYTGAAGIHSEDGPIAHARNNLMNRRSSAAMSTEEEILKKKMKSLSVSRKSLETSMLSYSQKMRDIAEKRDHDTIHSSSYQKPSYLTSNNNASNNNIMMNNDPFVVNNKSLTSKTIFNQRVQKRNVSLPLAIDLTQEDTTNKTNYSKQNFRSADKPYNMTSVVTSDQRGRVSVDSGVGMDSDSYLSETESVSRPRLLSNASVKSDDTTHLESLPSPNRKAFVRKSGQDKRRRFRRIENSELETVLDTENPDRDDNGNNKTGVTVNTDVDETLTISPFPENHSNRDLDSLSSRLGSISEHDDLYDNLTRTRILDPLTSRPIRKWKHNTSPKPKKKTPAVLTKPKVTYSPSVMAMKLRRLQLKNKKALKPSHHSFKYSDAVETALRSLNSSPEGHRDRKIANTFSPPLSPDLLGLDLNELLNEVIRRPNDRDILLAEEPEEEIQPQPHRLLYRDRSFSEPVLKPSSFVSSLEQVREDDESELRSVLRKNTLQYPAEKKNVQFFLPDVFLHANACTSRPAALR